MPPAMSPRGMRRGSARLVLQPEPHRGKGGAVKAGLLAAPLRVSLHLRRRSLDAHRRAATVPAARADRLRHRDRQPRRTSGAADRRAGDPAPRRAGLQFRGAAADGAGHRRHAVRLQDVHRRRGRGDLPPVQVDGWAFDIEVAVPCPAAAAADHRGADRVALPAGIAPEPGAGRRRDAPRPPVDPRPRRRSRAEDPRS